MWSGLFNYRLLLALMFFKNVSLQNLMTDCSNDFGGEKHIGECKPVEDCKYAALQGNCLNSFICCIPDRGSPPSIAENSFIKKNIFLKLVGNTPRNNELYNYFAQSMNEADIYNQYKAAAYFATLVGETNYFKDLELKASDPDFNDDLGNSETTDGSKYRGRGAISLRGKSNYILANSKLSNSLG